VTVTSHAVCRQVLLQKLSVVNFQYFAVFGLIWIAVA
jgi:hypothetical protein